MNVALGRLMAAGMVYQNATDHLRGDAKEMGVILPRGWPLCRSMRLSVSRECGRTSTSSRWTMRILERVNQQFSGQQLSGQQLSGL